MSSLRMYAAFKIVWNRHDSRYTWRMRALGFEPEMDNFYNNGMLIVIIYDGHE